MERISPVLAGLSYLGYTDTGQHTAKSRMAHLPRWMSVRNGDLDVVIGGESGTLYFFRRDWLEGREHRYEFPPGS